MSFLRLSPPLLSLLASPSVAGNPRLTVEQVDHQLIGAHHDGGVGDLPDQVCGQAAVQGPVALLSEHDAQGLEEGAVLAALLS